MSPAIPQYDLAMLITLDIGLALLGLILTFFGIWIIVRQTITIAGMVERTARSTERVAQIAERIDARLRRQFPDIGNELGD